MNGYPISYSSRHFPEGGISGFMIILVLMMSSVFLNSCSDSATGSSENNEPDVEDPVVDDPPEAPDFSEIVEMVRSEYGLPGMGAAIVSIDHGVTIGVSGERRIGSGVSVELDDKWSLGSNTKAITAFLSARAVDDGLVAWDDTVEELFPEFAGVMLEQYRKVTLLDLLGHRSGFVNRTVPDVDGRELGNGTTPASLRLEMVEWVVQQVPENPIGEYHYSNLGFSTAGAILERSIGESYEEWAAQILTSQLQLNHYGYGPQDEAGGDSQPVSHRFTDGEWVIWEAHENTPFRRPSGGAHGSLSDWAKIISEMIIAWRGSSDFITPGGSQVINTPLTPMPNGSEYAAGWMHVGERSWAGERPGFMLVPTVQTTRRLGSDPMKAWRSWWL